MRNLLLMWFLLFLLFLWFLWKPRLLRNLLLLLRPWNLLPLLPLLPLSFQRSAVHLGQRPRHPRSEANRSAYARLHKVKKLTTCSSVERDKSKKKQNKTNK